MITDEEVFEGERSHLDKFWPDRPHEEFVWTLGSIGQSLPRFRVRRIAPAEQRDPWLYVTVGPGKPPRTTLTEWNSSCCHRVKTRAMSSCWRWSRTFTPMLVSLPYPCGPALERCELRERHIQFLWLVPITAAEANLVRSHGQEALERLLERGNVNVISPKRRSLA